MKHIIALFIVSILVTTIGALFKLEHWHGAGTLFAIGTILQCISLVLGIIKVLRMEGFKKFLDS